MRRAWGVLLRVLVVLTGLWVGVLGAFVHRLDVRWLGVDWPWGLLLALLAAGSAALACGQVVRVGAAWFGLGWVGALAGQQVAASQGYLVGGDVLGYAYLVGGLGVVGLAVLRAPRVGR